MPQPEAGITIYEPTSFVTGVRNQIEMDIGLVDFALANLCITAGCEIEEAAARLGYAAWNLDKSVPHQLAEAETRNEIEGDKLESPAGDVRGGRSLPTRSHAACSPTNRGFPMRRRSRRRRQMPGQRAGRI